MISFIKHVPTISCHSNLIIIDIYSFLAKTKQQPQQFGIKFDWNKGGVSLACRDNPSTPALNTNQLNFLKFFMHCIPLNYTWSSCLFRLFNAKRRVGGNFSLVEVHCLGSHARYTCLLKSLTAPPPPLFTYRLSYHNPIRHTLVALALYPTLFNPH